MIRILAATAPLALVLFFVGCQTAPVPSTQLPEIQQPVSASHSAKAQENDLFVAGSSSYLDSVRWWDQGKQDPMRELVVETPEELEARVPKRNDPKIVILLYHNIVFGRTGGEYNRDLYNFEHDLIFLRNRSKIIGLDELPSINSGKIKLDTDASILTFDDGDLSIYAIVFPLLKNTTSRRLFSSSQTLWEQWDM